MHNIEMWWNRRAYSTENYPQMYLNLKSAWSLSHQKWSVPETQQKQAKHSWKEKRQWEDEKRQISNATLERND